MIVGVGEQQRVGQAGLGHPVAAGVRDPLDDSVDPQAPKVVGHLPGGDVLGVLAQEGRDEFAQITVGESMG